MFFRISKQAHKQSVLDFVDKQHSINKLAMNMQLERTYITFYIEWFHQQNKFAAPIKNMQGINACLKEYYVSCK